MQLCVGAVSRRVVEEAAALGVRQIVASRRQVNEHRGYTGMTPADLVKLVRDAGTRTMVVRDHGGPGQGGWDDDGIEAFDLDVAAGFDGLHLDVSALPIDEQPTALKALATRYGPQVRFLEVGGEREPHEHNLGLLEVARSVTFNVACCVVETGAHVWGDRQYGRIDDTLTICHRCADIEMHGVIPKMHNADFVGGRSYAMVGMYNLAPELGVVETEATLACLDGPIARMWLSNAYNTLAWHRWFGPDEGTWYERARCALRYMPVQPPLGDEGESFVRERIRDAIVRG